MKLKKNEIEIIELLISSSSYISSYDIATATGISRRLIRDEMANIRAILKSLGYELVSKTSKGYIIKGKSSTSLQTLVNIVEEAKRQRESVFPTTPLERQDYIIKRLIDENDYIKVDDLAEELLISRSTISSDLKHAREHIKKYNLSFRQKPNYGICIVGNEVDKRKPLCDYLFSNLGKSEMYFDYLRSFIFQKDSLEYGIIQILKENQIEMSDIALCDFLLGLSVSVSRILTNKSLTNSPDLTPILHRKEFDVAKQISLYITSRIHCPFNEHEINSIAIQLICKRSSRANITSQNPITKQLITEIFDEIQKQTLITFHDQKFVHTFSIYVETVILGILYNEKIRNPLYNELKTAYPLAYELAEITASIIQKHIHQPCSMSALAFFATLFHTAMNNHKSSKKKVLLLCGLGGGSNAFNSQLILERFEHQITIEKKSQFYKITDENLENYDFIISTVPIRTNLAIPHIDISPIITQNDLNRIDDYLSYCFNSSKMELLFHPKLYKDHVKARSHKGIINEFYKMLKKQYPTIKESFKRNIQDSSFVCYDNKLGLLKLNKPLNNNNILAVLILDQPVMIEQQESQVLILFSCIDNNNYIYNTINNILTNFSKDTKSIDVLLSDPSYPKFLTSIMKYQ